MGGEIAIGYENAGKWSLTVDYLFKACGEYSGNKVFRNLDWNWKNRDKSKKDQEIYDKWVYPSKDNDGKKDSTGKSDDAKNRQNYKTPHGTVEYVSRVAIKGTVNVSKTFSFMIQPAFTYVSNSGNVDGKTEKGFEIAVSVSKKFF